jgi:hypothetical protein
MYGDLTLIDVDLCLIKKLLMELINLNVRLVNLPPDIELILFMIREELKSTALFNGLARVGLEDFYLQSHFSTLVLSYMGFEERPDDLLECYTDLISTYSEKVEADNDVIMKCAFDVYVEMMIEKKKRIRTSE